MTELKDVITVIVPIYNAESYLPECIESILGQTYSNLQIILIDDGSTDASGVICDRYAGMDERIEVHHTGNKGLVAARKLGISHATGKYVGFVDADDYIEANMYEFLLKDIVESAADFVHTGYIQEKEKEREVICGFNETILDLPNTEKREDALIKYVLRPERERYITYSIWSKLFTRNLLDRCYLQLPDRQQYGEDLLCLCLCFLESYRIRLSKRILYHYRVLDKSLSHLQSIDHMIKEVELNHSVIQVIQDYNRQIYRSLEKHICYFIKNRFLDTIEISHGGIVHIPRFYYKNVETLKGKRIVIYGAGSVGRDYYLQFCKYKNIEIVAWLDSNWQKCLYDYVSVSDISILSNYTFEKFIIAVKNEGVAKEIEDMLLEYGLPKEKIHWEEPGSILDENNLVSSTM